MPSRFQPIADASAVSNPYTLQQLDQEGEVVSETRAVARSCSEAIRGLKGVVDDAERIIAYDQEGKRAGEVSVEYWRQKKGRL